MNMKALLMVCLVVLGGVIAINSTANAQVTITCDYAYDCVSNDTLSRLTNCSTDDPAFQIPPLIELLPCEFGCDPTYSMCVIPPYYEILILLPILLSVFLLGRWAFVKKKRGRK